MKALFFFLFVTAYLSIISVAQTSLIQNIYNRNVLTLNGKWNYIVDQYETGYYDYRYMPYDRSQNKDFTQGAFYHDITPNDKTERVEYSFDKSATLLVPRDWNTQYEKLFLYEGTIWYRRKFDYKKKNTSNRVFVHFGAANYEANVYLNSAKLGQHIGGFTPFNFEITEQVKDQDNYLIVKVDNKRKREGIPTVNTDWFNYGGLTRDVTIVEVPETFICDYFIQLDKKDPSKISGFVQIDGKNKQQNVKILIPELKIEQKFVTDANGLAKFTIDAKKITKWEPANPKLYKVEVISDNDQISEMIGFRNIEAKGKDILLNGKSLFLRGICIHEENGVRGGRAFSREDAQMLLGWAKELNCNFVRLAHYPHNENMARVADELGILVWEEIPVYWTILWDNKETFKNAENQLSDLIYRDKNRASVIIWSIANETPVSPLRTEFLSKLATRARQLDPTRLISAALEKHSAQNNPLTQIVEDPFAEMADIVSFNQYIGWYDGKPDKCSKVNWEIKYDKPVIVSEFGGDALAGLHGDKESVWTEDYQEYLYTETCSMLERIPNLRGVTPWILADFRSPRRLLPNVQDGWNRKGLISETGNKKKAFFVLKNYYNKKGKDYNK